MSHTGTVGPQEAHLPYRRDIDGLRAIAVLAVLFFHAFPQWLHGGFVGVDIFFVISGFLISGIVLGGLQDGNLSLIDFYRRRIRRIFPALLAVLVVVYILGWLVLLPEDYASLGKHIAGGAGFIANLLLWGEAGYFDVAAETKPLLHLWSLGIEEQFYMLWPLFLLLIWRRPKLLLASLAGFFLISFTAGLLILPGNAVAAFYSPLTRFWELATGGMLAYTLQPAGTRGQVGGFLVRFRSVPVNASAISLLGAALIFAGIFLFNREQPFPGWRPLLPCLGTLLVLLAGPGAWFNHHLLSRRWMVWIGLISFPLYLWHWPALVFLRLVKVGRPAPIANLAALLVAVLLAWMTMRWIERPLRFGSQANRKTLTLLLGMTLVGGVGIGTWQQGGLPERFPRDLREALENRFDSRQAYRNGLCFLDAEQDASAFAEVCTHPADRAEKPRLLLWGDSHAAHLYPGLNEVLGQKMAILQLTAGGCPPLPDLDIAKRPFCPGINRYVLEVIANAPPEQVVLAGNWKSHDWSGIKQTIAQLQRAGVREIRVVGPVPQWHDGLPRRLLATVIANPSREIPVRMEGGLNREIFAVDQKMRKEIPATGAIYVSATDAFCVNQSCLTLVGDQVRSVTAWDYGHLTPAASSFLVGSPAWAGIGKPPP